MPRNILVTYRNGVTKRLPTDMYDAIAGDPNITEIVYDDSYCTLYED